MTEKMEAIKAISCLTCSVMEAQNLIMKVHLFLFKTVLTQITAVFSKDRNVK